MTGRSRGSTSRTAIISAAVELVDRVGLDGLTMRSLATELGVVPMATYRHFANKGELLDAILEDITSTVPLGDLDADWRTTARHLSIAIRDALLAHPGVVAALVNRPSLGPSAVRLTEAMYAALVRGGFPSDTLVASANLVFTYVLGFAALEAPRRSPAGSVDATLHVTQDEVNRAYGTVDPTLIPVTAELVPDAADFVSGAQFTWGLETILDGLERRRTGASPTP